MMRASLATATLLSLVTVTATANAHEVRGTISPSGMSFFAEQLPDYVPARLNPPDMTMDLFTCPGGRVVQFTQRDTEISIDVDSASMTVPANGVLRVELHFDVFAAGEAYILYPYACFGSATCLDELSIIDGRAVIDFQASLGVDGRPRVTVAGIELMVDEEDIALTLSDCAIDGVVNWVIDFAKDWFLDTLLDKLEGIAQDKLAPVVEDMIGGFMQFDGNLAIADFDFHITGLAVAPQGVTIIGDGDLSSPYAADACVGEDPGEPSSHTGPTPDIIGGAPTHLGLAVNLGLVDDVLYQVWREGMTCLTPAHLEAMGLDLDLEETAALLPGFPAGTELEIEMRLAVPPRVEGRAGGDATIALIMDGIEIDLIGHAPDGSTTELHLEADATAAATLDVDADINALVLKIDAVTLTRLEVNEEYALETGFDVAQLQAVAEALLIPGLIDSLGELPVTGPIFGVGDYYLIMREMRTTESHAIVKVDLFRLPANDTVAPNTLLVDYPRQVVRPHEAKVRVTGTDDKIPTELLRYRVSVDGVTRALSYVTEIEIGESAVTATYRVEVSAVDLHGNEDPTPETVDVTVDGVRPRLRLLTDAILELDHTETGATVEWTATDDLTAPERIVPRVALYQVVDPQDILSAELIGEVDLAPGDTSATVPVESGERYRVVVTVRDEAGNEAYTSIIVAVAGEPGGCGCRAGGAISSRGTGSALPILFAIGMILLRRRKTWSR